MSRACRAAATMAALIVNVCTVAQAVDVDGYLRVPAVHQSSSGAAACFKLAGAEAKYRLGNECEIYGELQLSEYAAVVQGVPIKAYAMGSWYQPNSDDNMFWSRRGDSALVQAYASMENLRALNGGNAWLGRRYYKREDMHINDFYYWNPTGLGGGVEDIDIGGVKLSYAVFREDNQDQPRFAPRHDIQLRGINVNADGDLEIGLSLIPKRATSGEAGWSVTAQHRQSSLLGDGWNKLALQYGVGPGTGLGATGPLASTADVTRLRVVEGVYAQIMPGVGGMLTAVYQKDRSNLRAQTWISAGGRLTYTFTEHIKLHTELGHDRVRPSDAATRALTKLTIAPAIAVGRNFWSRPELRLFYTYASWNDAARAAADGSADPNVASISSTGVFANRNHGSTIGLSVESWW